MFNLIQTENYTNLSVELSAFHTQVTTTQDKKQNSSSPLPPTPSHTSLRLTAISTSNNINSFTKLLTLHKFVPFCTICTFCIWLLSLNIVLVTALAGVTQLDGALSCRPKGHRFDSQSGHIARLWVRSQSGRKQEDNQSMVLSHTDVSLSLFLSLPLFLKTIKMCPSVRI